MHTNYQKLSLLLIVLIGTFTGLFLGKIESEASIAIISSIVAYGVANGIGASKGMQQSGVFTPKADEDELTATKRALEETKHLLAEAVIAATGRSEAAKDLP